MSDKAYKIGSRFEVEKLVTHFIEENNIAATYGKDSEGLFVVNFLVEEEESKHNMVDDIKVIWDALHAYREDCIPEGDSMYDEQWNEICTAMANIQETLDDPTNYQDEDID
tara:strand:+ start:96 stop:428 length:333 start_codon:yes stop_codon:yes gene_type:complete